MTRQQQYALVMAIRKAASEKGLRQCDLARAAGTSDGNISSAFVLKHAMSDEKWRLICEKVGLDFDAVINDPQLPEQEELPEQDPPEEKPQAPAPEEVPVRMLAAIDEEECRIILTLIEAHLGEQVRKNGLDFALIRKAVELHAKCERVVQAR